MRINLEESCFIIVDIQEKLMPFIFEGELLIKNCQKLIEGLKILNVPCILSEQYSKGMGPTVSEIKSLVGEQSSFDKITFSCVQDNEILNEIKKINPKFVIICGIEAHICVLQTVIDLSAIEITPVLVADCISSRNPVNKKYGIKRAMQEGAIVTTYEAILFELLQKAKTDQFKMISNLIK